MTNNGINDSAAHAVSRSVSERTRNKHVHRAMSHLIRNHLFRLRCVACPLYTHWIPIGRVSPEVIPIGRHHFGFYHPHRYLYHPPVKLRQTYFLGACLFTTQMGFKAARYFATILPPPPTSGGANPPSKPPEVEERPGSLLGIVLGEIRNQEKVFNIKKKAEQEVEDNLMKINTAHLEGSIKTEMLRSTSAAPYIPSTAPPEASSEDTRPLIFETPKEPPPASLSATLNVDALKRVITPGRLGTMREIVYPRSGEKLQITFKPGTSESTTTDTPPAPPSGPRFLESITHKVKTNLTSTKPVESTASMDLKSRLLDLTKRTTPAGTITGASHVGAPAIRSPLTPESQENQATQRASGTTTGETKLMAVLTDQPLRLLPLFTKSKKGQASIESPAKTGALAGTAGDSSGEAPAKAADGAEEEEDEEKQRTSAQHKRWMRLKYTMGFLGIMSCVFSGYLILFIGAPKYDSRGNLIMDQYSNLPVMMQYYSRIRDEFETYNRMIKEPSRDKLLPDVLEPPYYQPPYTLVLEFTDLLVHPEWTYQCGWRFKKRPGVDQFLEALYTRFEVVVYTAQMGLTVFPIMEALDGRNLISYKLVRDATNFIDGDHVKDLDKINRDLSKVVVVDWNPQSVKLHKNNLFQIPRWEGNDDDNTLLDLAAFLIAISEWEVQDVRSVLQYYAQFDNPLAKFKENQMQALQATQS